jgi:photosystem II protein
MQAALTNSTFMGSKLAQPKATSTSTRAQPLRVHAVFTKSSKAAASKTTKEKVAGQTFKVTTGVGKDGLKRKEVTLGFTAENELFVGRMAMLGVAASLIGEILTGKGAIGQLGLETGLPIYEVDAAILALIAFNAIAAFAPVSGKFVPEEDFSDRQKGALQDPSISILEPKKFFGFSKFGSWSKENELFVGRVAQLGFAASLIGEAVTGQGILGQIGLETGIPLFESEPLLLAFIALTVFAALSEGTGRFVKENKN